MMAALAVMTTAAFAQDDLVKSAKKLCDKGELEEAVKTITPALTSDQTEDKAEAWNVMSEIQYQIFMKGQAAEQANKANNSTTPFDTAAMHKAMVASLEAAMKCDEYDRQPNAKGKVKIQEVLHLASLCHLRRSLRVQQQKSARGNQGMEALHRQRRGSSFHGS